VTGRNSSQASSVTRMPDDASSEGPMTRFDRIAVVGLAAAALGLVAVVVLAWGGSIADDSPSPPRGSPSPPEQARRSAAPPAPPPTSLERPPPPASPRAEGVHWPMGKLMRALDGSRVRIGSTVVRVEADTTLCSGENTPVRRNGARFWTRFHCTFTTFAAGVPDRDVEFRVRPVGPRRLSVTGARWIGG
jgi:hypothetical protein